MKMNLSFLAMIALLTMGVTTRDRPWPEGFYKTNGSHILRAILTPDATTAEDNITTSGGNALVYVFSGGERVCYEANTTDAYVRVGAAAGLTAALLGRIVKAGAAGDVVCDTLLPSEVKVAAFCSASGPCEVKVFEIR